MYIYILRFVVVLKTILLLLKLKSANWYERQRAVSHYTGRTTPKAIGQWRQCLSFLCRMLYQGVLCVPIMNNGKSKVCEVASYNSVLLLFSILLHDQPQTTPSQSPSNGGNLSKYQIRIMSQTIVDGRANDDSRIRKYTDVDVNDEE